MRFSFLICAIVFQFACLAVMAVPNIYTLANGREIVLISKPVDPFALFKGDYVTLSYDFSDKARDLPADQDIWVVLTKGETSWTSKTIVRGDKPELGADEIAIRGKTNEWNGGVKCGIEQFYVPEQTGRDLEKSPRLIVTVAVDQFGHAVVKRVSK